MKRIIFFLIAGLLFSNCAHRIVRTGYKVKKSDYKTCDVVIKKNISLSDTLITKIGEIKLGESGFSVSCSESHAINILKGEASAIGADLIVITEENRPDFWSTRYRCRAEFYKLNSNDVGTKVYTDETYTPDNLQKRVSQDRMNNTAIIIGSAIVAFSIGIISFL
jgi:hypothetical protein